MTSLAISWSRNGNRIKEIADIYILYISQPLFLNRLSLDHMTRCTVMEAVNKEEKNIKKG